MRRALIFSGTSHPGLSEAICERLGTVPAKCELRKFSNGETSVGIGCSVRDQDVFVVQSGSSKVNDSIMELLIMIAACKGGSANKITAVMPYFPYSKQSKKKSHRGAITARMVANQLSVAGVDHVITVDLHASQMQGFFTEPVDNLYAEPLISKWIRHNVPNRQEAVVVSKNPGGTKRVTQLADVLKQNFALITTDRRRNHPLPEGGWMSSRFQSRRHSPAGSDSGDPHEHTYGDHHNGHSNGYSNGATHSRTNSEYFRTRPARTASVTSATSAGHVSYNRTSNPTSANPITPPLPPIADVISNGAHLPPHPQDDFDDEYTDDQAQSVTYGRLVQGHIVDDDFPSPSPSTVAQPDGDPMLSSIHSLPSLNHDALGGTIDANNTDDEEDADAEPGTERMMTLVGDVRGKTALILDDMIDRAGSWIAAAEHCKKRAGAKRVICLATHGVFGGECLREMDSCDCIDQIVVTNSFPIDPAKMPDRAGGVGFTASGSGSKGKLTVIDLSMLLSESIRRNHNGESISTLFQHFYE